MPSPFPAAAALAAPDFPVRTPIFDCPLRPRIRPDMRLRARGLTVSHKRRRDTPHDMYCTRGRGPVISHQPVGRVQSPRLCLKFHCQTAETTIAEDHRRCAASGSRQQPVPPLAIRIVCTAGSSNACRQRRKSAAPSPLPPPRRPLRASSGCRQCRRIAPR